MSADAKPADQGAEYRRPRRGPGRFLAPLALILVVVAVLVIVHSARTHASSSAPVQVTSTTRRTHAGTPARHRRSTKRAKSGSTTGSSVTTASGSTPGRTFTVQSGDTYSVIAVKTGVSVATLEKLNPRVSASALRVGEVIKLK